MEAAFRKQIDRYGFAALGDQCSQDRAQPRERMRTLRSALVLVLTVCLGACTNREAPRSEYESPTEVLAAMKAAYAGTWYRNLTFVQTTIQYTPDGLADTTAWFEALELPGKLRIDIGDPVSGNSWIFRNDSIYVFTQGVLSDARPTLHPLLLLGFDAYFMETNTLVGKLDSLGFDVSVLSDTTWQNRPVWIIGANRGDTGAQQFWIDKERLCFVRLLQQVNGTSQQDVRFNNYRQLGGGWVAPDVEFYIDGRLQLREAYHDMATPEAFDPALFSPTSWRTARHWLEPDR